MDLDEFRKSRALREDLGVWSGDEDLNGQRGYVYANSFYIVIEPDGRFSSPVGNTDILDEDLEKVEQFLWYEFATFEMNPSTDLA